MEKENKLLLQANDISIVFGGLRAVSNFSCSIEDGELVGLIGPNGAGKTTVFNMLSGVYTPTEGEIVFWDRAGNVHKVNKKTPAQLNGLGISRTFQNIRLFGNLSVADNVRIALHGLRTVNPVDVLFAFRLRGEEELRGRGHRLLPAIGHVFQCAQVPQPRAS